MKNILRIFVFLAIIAGICITWSVRTAAQDTPPDYFGDDTLYNITYEVSTFEVDVLEKVRLVKTAVIGDQTFLVVLGATLATQRNNRPGFIRMDCIRSMLPAYMVQPDRTINRGMPSARAE